jgi:hypothetical protein
MLARTGIDPHFVSASMPENTAETNSARYARYARAFDRAFGNDAQ